MHCLALFDVWKYIYIFFFFFQATVHTKQKKKLSGKPPHSVATCIVGPHNASWHP